MIGTELDAYLRAHASGGMPHAADVAQTGAILAEAGIRLAATIAEGASGGAFAATNGAANADGDAQRGLDLLADDMFLSALAASPVALYASEELDQPALLDAARPLALAIDPLDGSSNIDTNIAIGTIFSLRPRVGDAEADPLASFLGPGRDQLASGFLIYGSQLCLVLTLGRGTAIFAYSPAAGRFRLAVEACAIPRKTCEFAINAANYRHWNEPVRLYSMIA